MTTQVVVQPAGDSDAGKHYVDTVAKPVEIDRVLKVLGADATDSLKSILRSYNSTPVWGVTRGERDINLNKWNRVQRGDIVLFSRDGFIRSSASVMMKIRSERLALDLWGRNKDGETWECMYFLDDLQPLLVPYRKFNEIVGYKPNYVIQGFNVLDAEKSRRFLEEFDLYSEKNPVAVSEEDYRKALERLAQSDTLDKERTSLSRVEQSFLREKLFAGKAFDECCLCGHSLPVELLVAAHIKKRALCTLQEKLDVENIVAPMCRLGCDELYERGFISVDGLGKIVRQGRIPVTAPLETRLATLIGKPCPRWSSKTRAYFANHLEAAVMKYGTALA